MILPVVLRQPGLSTFLPLLVTHTGQLVSAKMLVVQQQH
jgi:hypothetical protein